MTTKRVCLLGSMALFISGCAVLQTRQVTPAEAPYVTRLQAVAQKYNQDPSFPVAQEKIVWERVQSFIARYSNAKVRTASDTIIETSNPEVNGIAFNAVKVPKGDTFIVQTRCIMSPASPLDSQALQHRCGVNAAALVMYMVTGEEPPPSLVQDCVEVKSSTSTPVAQ